MTRRASYKTCRHCNQEKPLSQFSYTSLRDRSRDTVCKDCRKEIYQIKYAGKPRAKPTRKDIPLVLPVICPCGARITQPTNGVWLCPDCAPSHHAILSVPILGVTMSVASNCWSCRYQIRCADRIQQGRPVLCEAYLQEEHNLLLLKNQTFAFTTTL